MKAEVLKKFKDKHTKKIHHVGDVIEVTQERFDEILETDSFVKKMDDEEEIPEEKELEKAEEETEKTEEEAIAPAQNEETKEDEKNTEKNSDKEKNNEENG